MIPVLSYKEALAIDKQTIIENNITNIDLIDSAGKAIAEFIIENIYNPFNQTFINMAGPGNNGSDAIVTHYYLKYYGLNSRLLIFNKSQFKSLLFKKYEIDLTNVDLYTESYILNNKNWYIDGIFGIGLKRDLSGIYKHIIDRLIQCPLILSIDIPSGIYCNNGLSASTYISSLFTLIMGYPKYSHYFNLGLEAAGSMFRLNIGLNKISADRNIINQLEPDDIFKMMPNFLENDNKYTNGKLIIFSGTKAYTGASILSAKSAYATGAGIIKVITPESLNSIYESSLIEAVTVPLIDSNSDIFIDDNVSVIIKEIQWGNVIIFGPGLINCSSIIMSKILKNINQPLILDASGFKPIIDGYIKISDLPKKTILTPHYYEFSKLFKININDFYLDPINYVKSTISILNGRVLILKGPTTIIVTSDSKIFFINNGHPNLSTAGTGDVLTGLIGALISKLKLIDDAAILGVYIHNFSSTLFSEEYQPNGLTASKLIDILPMAMESVRNVH